MKRSYDASFVSDSYNNTGTTSTHSFEQPAALATQQSFTTIASIYPHQTVLYEAPQYIGYAQDFQIPLYGITPTVHSAYQTSLRYERSPLQAVSPNLSSSCQHRLAGLGITFEDSALSKALEGQSPPLTFYVPRQTGPDSSISYARLPTTSTLEVAIDSSATQLPVSQLCYVTSLGIPMFASPQAVRIDEVMESWTGYADNDAYSPAPNIDYMAHSASAITLPPTFSATSNFDDLLDNDVNLGKNHDAYRPLLSPSVSFSGLTNAATPEEPIIGLFPDINMRELVIRCRAPSVGVDPSDLMGDTEVEAKMEEDNSPTIDQLDMLQYPSSLSSTPEIAAEFTEDALSAIVSVLAASVKGEQTSQTALDPSTLGTFPAPQHQISGAGGPVQPPFPTRSSKVSPSATPCDAPPSVQFPDPKAAVMTHKPRPPLVELPPQNQLPFQPAPFCASIRQPSPVLNAHLGVNLEDIRRRANDFRRAHPGQELDKLWLQDYAGRLSQRGELMQEYRCYVTGCSQMNKRRDHILVHVGAHVEHRPFQCNYCGMRFLRKNECKRHISSHAGEKPYTCPICAPYREKSFVRQDLLKRHMKITHGVQPEPERRKRARLAAEIGEAVAMDVGQ